MQARLALEQGRRCCFHTLSLRARIGHATTFSRGAIEVPSVATPGGDLGRLLQAAREHCDGAPADEDLHERLFAVG